MRCLMTAGAAMERDNTCGYNCSYLPVDSLRSFDEALYILMCGTGVGYSVERQFISDLPRISEHFETSDTTIKVGDSKSGWARGLKELIALLVGGQIPKWDLFKLRPAGAILKTFGGRSSGPDPLHELFEFVVKKFENAKGRRFNSLECHDILCKIGECVVVGGVRRSAMISLSNFSDDRMRRAKMGEWWVLEPQRALANNSICFTEKPDMGAFLNEWNALYQSKSGERGLFNRSGITVPERREKDHDFGTNPCSEIILRPFQFCNLTEAVVRPEDTLRTLQQKVEYAAILGTWQSTLTNFKYLRKIWQQTTEEERLLGVSLTGIMDNVVTADGPDGLAFDKFYNSCGEIESTAYGLEKLREKVIKTNDTHAQVLGIRPSAATTCVKPSGTVSQLVDSASGIHPRYSQYYIRRIRQDTKDPLTAFLIDEGFPAEPDVMNKNAMVFSFPMKAPPNSVTRHDLSSISHLNLWKVYQDAWCEHKPSVTIYVGESDWMEVGAWVYKHFDDMSGISFLPKADDDHVYQQAPYEEIDEKTYKKLSKAMPKEIKWDKLTDYESEDHTVASQELACTAGVCEL